MKQQINQLVAEKAYLLDCLVNKFPTGIFSYVMDSYDYFGMLDKVLPSVKNEIMQRDGKFVVRGDSGCPIHIIAGYRVKELEAGLSTEEVHHQMSKAIKAGYEVVEADGLYFKVFDNKGYLGYTEIPRSEAVGTIQRLYEIFGGTKNAKGYLELDAHIGMIYGDGINLQRQDEILKRLEEKGFASLNIVFGVGSYSLNMVGRDHLGMAIKATNAIVDIDGEAVDKPIYKDPKTDSSKKSARGLLRVEVEGNQVTSWCDNVTRYDETQGALRTVLEDGLHYNLETLYTMRERLWN